VREIEVREQMKKGGTKWLQMSKTTKKKRKINGWIAKKIGNEKKSTMRCED